MIPTIRRHVLPTLLAGILLLSLGATTTSHAPTAHDAAKKRVLVVYYFYHTVRCAACISIEKMTDEVLRGQFGNELRSGRILWKPTNLDLEKTDALEKHYNLEVQTLILSDTKTGKERRWVNLDKIWDNYNIEPEFKMYVAGAVREWLK